jgi:hypothetical protein
MVPFTDAPVSMTVKNYKGREFRVQMSVTLEDETHMTDIAQFRRVWHGTAPIKKSKEAILDFTNLIKRIEAGESELPEICDLCKKELSSRAFVEGEFMDVVPNYYSKGNLSDSDWGESMDDISKIDNFFGNEFPNEGDDNNDPDSSGKGHIGFN